MAEERPNEPRDRSNFDYAIPGDPPIGDEKGFDEMLGELEDNIFGITDDLDERKKYKSEEPKEKKDKEKEETFPTLINQKTAEDILKDVLKEKNQRKYDVMGVELLIKPYWFFTYTCELVLKDENGNVMDSEEVGGRVAIDAKSGAMADHLQEISEHQPITVVPLKEELRHLTEDGIESRLQKRKIRESQIEGFVKQKISGVLRADKDNVSVAGFELIWAPVYKFWLTIKKRTHNVQIDATGGYPLNYDDIPLKAKTWEDKLLDDIDLLKDPKKWKDFVKKKGKAIRSGSGGKQPQGKPSNNTLELVFALIVLTIFFYGLIERNIVYMGAAVLMVLALLYYMNKKRAPKPVVAPMQQVPPAGPPQYRN